MPKRIGYLYEQVLTLENCIRAVLEGTANLKKTKKIRRIRSNPERYAKQILSILKNGWVPGPTRIKYINEGTEQKTRKLRIPNTLDHLIHVAIMLPLIPILEKRFDFYCCGSVRGRGSKRVINTIKGWMSGKPVKCAGEADVHHAYAETTAEVVMSKLRRFIKDEKYLSWHSTILQQMGGVLAIGFQPSHWYFNLVMTDVDNAIRRVCGKGLKLVRFMDNYIFGSNRKRTIHKAMQVLSEECEKIGLSINNSRQVFSTRKRAIKALSYRYFRGYTILRKSTMYNMTARLKTAGNHMCAHLCRGAVSRIGLLRHCNSYNYRKDHVYPTISIKRAKEVISRADRKRLLCTTA